MSATTGCECGRIVIHTILKVRWLPISGKIRLSLGELLISDSLLSIARLMELTGLRFFEPGGESVWGTERELRP